MIRPSQHLLPGDGRRFGNLLPHFDPLPTGLDRFFLQAEDKQMPPRHKRQPYARCLVQSERRNDRCSMPDHETIRRVAEATGVGPENLSQFGNRLRRTVKEVRPELLTPAEDAERIANHLRRQIFNQTWASIVKKIPNDEEIGVLARLANVPASSLFVLRDLPDDLPRSLGTRGRRSWSHHYPRLSVFLRLLIADVTECGGRPTVNKNYPEKSGTLVEAYRLLRPWLPHECEFLAADQLPLPRLAALKKRYDKNPVARETLRARSFTSLHFSGLSIWMAELEISYEIRREASLALKKYRLLTKRNKRRRLCAAIR
jgi:hypothetical protein